MSMINTDNTTDQMYGYTLGRQYPSRSGYELGRPGKDDISIHRILHSIELVLKLYPQMSLFAIFDHHWVSSTATNDWFTCSGLKIWHGGFTPWRFKRPWVGSFVRVIIGPWSKKCWMVPRMMLLTSIFWDWMPLTSIFCMVFDFIWLQYHAIGPPLSLHHEFFRWSMLRILSTEHAAARAHKPWSKLWS